MVCRCLFHIDEKRHLCYNDYINHNNRKGDTFIMNENQVFNSTTEQVVSSKSKIVTGLLAIFLGTCGVDQFYLGKIGGGIASICITIGCIIVGAIIGLVLGLLSIITFGLTMFLAIPAGLICGLASWVWPIIRAIQAFTGKAKDGNGASVIN